MSSKGLGTSNSPIVIESEAEDSPVKDSNVRPHLVTAKKNGQYACDNDCPNWKSLGICSHSVVAAEDNGDLQTFVEWVKRVKKVPNTTKLVTTKMPKGRGRKGTAPPCKRKKKEVVTRKQFTEI